MSAIKDVLNKVQTIENKLLDEDGVKTSVTISLATETYAYLGVTVFIAGLLVMLASWAIQIAKAD